MLSNYERGSINSLTKNFNKLNLELPFLLLYE